MGIAVFFYEINMQLFRKIYRVLFDIILRSIKIIWQYRNFINQCIICVLLIKRKTMEQNKYEYLSFFNLQIKV